MDKEGSESTDMIFRRRVNYTCKYTDFQRSFSPGERSANILDISDIIYKKLNLLVSKILCREKQGAEWALAQMELPLEEGGQNGDQEKEKQKKKEDDPEKSITTVYNYVKYELQGVVNGLKADLMGFHDAKSSPGFPCDTCPVRGTREIGRCQSGPQLCQKNDIKGTPYCQNIDGWCERKAEESVTNQVDDILCCDSMISTGGFFSKVVVFFFVVLIIMF